MAGPCGACQTVARLIKAFYHAMEYSAANGTLNDGVLPAVGYEKPPVVTLGSLEQLTGRTHCTSCQDIVNKLIREDFQPSSYDELIFESNRDYLSISLAERPDQFSLRLRRIEASTELPYEVGRAFDSQKFDVALLRKWIGCCQASHGPKCLSSELPPPRHQIYLIDVEAGCLVHLSTDSRYIALSYVWGSATTFQTTKSSLTYLQRPGSIKADGGDLTIPNTIRDAFRLVSLLGERYLWVDTFCIVQDDAEMKQRNLNSMASIYANAYFTIVAADGKDGNYGLRGIGGNAKPRNVSCGIIRFHNGQEVIASRTRGADLGYTVWGSRGWTYQEGLFSRRVLVFNGLVSWICRRSVWEEDVCSPTEDVGYAPRHEPKMWELGLAAQIPRWPDLSRWADLVGQFNQRKLTFDTDIVDAFSGATSAFNRQFSSGILWGIPEIYFDYCILWKPMTALRRRTTPSAATLPSWSWVGWEGDIALVGIWPIITNIPGLDDQTVQVQPMVEWYKSSTLTANPVSVKNIYHRLQRTYSNSESKELPAGWTQSMYLDGTPYYSNSTVPSVRFRYPMPLANDNIESLPNNQDRFLSFKARRAWLSLGPTASPAHPAWTCCPVCLVDERGAWAGVLLLGTLSSNRPPAGEPCELIALSLGTAVKDGDYLGILDEWEMPERPRDGEFYRFYNVMYIEWENGIAHRRAVGTVYKEMWERQALEDIDVVLG